MSPSVTYRLLTRNQWRTFFRALKARQNLFVWAVFAVMGLYVSFTLIVLGLYFDLFASRLAPGHLPVALVNAYALPAFFGLFTLRFLFQKTPSLKLRPYLHLPIARSRLVRFFQATSLLSLHNVYPLLFFAPFWGRYVLGTYPSAGAAAWLAGVVCALVASNFANLLIRSVLTRHETRFLLTMGGFLTLVYLDERFGYHLAQTASTALFDALLHDSTAALLLVLAFPVWLAAASHRMLLQRLRTEERLRPARRNTWRLPWLENAGPVGQLLLLEARMMWRNRRPRHYLLISLLFSTLYLLFFLANPAVKDGFILGAVIGLFASGGFVLNYGQLMFSWESSYFDGLLARNVSPGKLILAKLLLLQGSCLALFLLSLPLFLWFRPDLLGLHAAFLFYNAGVTTVVVMTLALRNRRPVDASKSGGFFNYEGFSAAHWLWFVPTALPPTLFLFFFRHAPQSGLIILGALGLASLLLVRLWVAYFASRFARHKYAMAEGFRR